MLGLGVLVLGILGKNFGSSKYQMLPVVANMFGATKLSTFCGHLCWA